MIAQGLGLPAGVPFGIIGALGVTRLTQSLLFRMRATDPATFAIIALLFLLVALLASCIPARRATHIDPMSALRVG